MTHVVYPEDDGCVIAEVWRTEAEGHAYVTDVLRPSASEVGLGAGEMTTRRLVFRAALTASNE